MTNPCCYDIILNTKEVLSLPTSIFPTSFGGAFLNKMGSSFEISALSPDLNVGVVDPDSQEVGNLLFLGDKSNSL